MNLENINNMMLRDWAEQNDIPIEDEYRCAYCRELLEKVSERTYTCKSDGCEGYLGEFEVKE